MENIHHIKALYLKYLQNEHTAEELDDLLSYFYKAKGETELSSIIKEELESESGDEMHQAVQSLLARLDHDLLLAINEREKQVTKRSLWFYRGVAATIALVLGLSVFFYLNIQNDPELKESIVSTDIAPGKNAATLVLPDGKTINLSDAKTGIVIDDSKLTYKDGSIVTSNSANGQKNTDELPIEELKVSTPRGGQYQIALPDGTQVWLNAASLLKFPSNFSSLNERKVELIGEAYFEVTENKQKPFIVKSGEQEVRVLGTHFNVNSYADEASIKTTLIEGSVMVKARGEQVVLKPKQQAALKDKIYVQNVDVENEIAWKNGDFVFDSDDLESIMRKISRWYDVDVVYDEKPIKKMRFGGIVSRAKNISAVLKIMKSTGQVSFKVKDRRITVIQH